MKIYLIILLILTVFAGILKAADPTFTIKLNNNNFPVQFCTGSVLVADRLTIDVVGNTNIQKVTISINEGFIAGEDELNYSGVLTASRPFPGTLVLSGNNTMKDFETAIRAVSYSNSKSNPTLGNRKITISLGDADYLDYTHHFYRFVSNPGIYWSQAKIDAEAMSYYGLKGYLATITSKIENDFIISKTQGVGYIGATDKDFEGEWHWVTGPEGLETGGKGRLFWKGTGAQAQSNPSVYGPQNGEYSNWDRLEPNNALHGNNYENFGHITVFPSDPVNSWKWNDVQDRGGDGDWYPKGYIVEFGGMPGETTFELSATLVLQVNTVTFANAGILSAICEGTSVTLNQPDLYTAIPATYSWNPTQTLSDATIANPVATPTAVPTTTYTVTGTRGTCPQVTATYTIPVNPKPLSLLKPEENICNGQTISLDPGVHKNYSWGDGAIFQTIPVKVTGDYTVTLTSDKNCTATSTTKVVVHDYPKIDALNLKKLICGEPKSTTVNISSNASSYTLTSADGRATVNGGLNVTVPSDGVYPMVYTANHKYCPIPEPFNLSFYKNPDGILDVDGRLPNQPCFGYNLNAIFTPANDLTGANYEWNFGGELIASGVDLSLQVVPLGISLLKRDLNLKVSRDGCSSKFTEPGILVRPNLNLTVDQFAKVCVPLDVVFTATSAGAIKFDWDTGDKVFSGLTPNQPYTYKNAGFWDVKLKVTTADDCKNEVKIPKMVHVAPVPIVAFSLSPTDCLEPGENQISFTGTGLTGNGDDKYIWDLYDFAASEQLNDPQGTPGPFIFDLKTKPSAKLGLKVISEFGCESTPENIILNRKPDFTITSDVMAGCIPFEPKLSGLKNINDLVDEIDFTWAFSNGTSLTGQQVTSNFNVPDKKYTVTLEGKNASCKNEVTETDFLQTFPKPKAAFSMDNAVVYNDKPDVKFTDSSEGANEYFWNFGDGSTSSLQSPLHHFVKTGHRTVLLEVTNSNLCTDTVSQKLLVAFDRLFPPTGFSPNAPKEVDRIFKLNSEGLTPEGYQLTVLSRWNDLIFEAKDEIKGWDGHLKNGTLAPAGSYVWILSFTDFLGRKHRQTGTVTLVY